MSHLPSTRQFQMLVIVPIKYSTSFVKANFLKEQEWSRRALFYPLYESMLGKGLDLKLHKVYRLNYLKGLATIVKCTWRGLNVPLPKTVNFSAFTHIHRHLFSPAFIDHDLLFYTLSPLYFFSLWLCTLV